MAAWLSSTGISHHSLLPHIPFLCSQQQHAPWNCTTIPKLQLPVAAPSRGPASLSGVFMATARNVLFSFHLDFHRSAVSLSALNVSPLTQTIAPMWGSDRCFSFPSTKRRSCPTNTPIFPPVPSSYQVLHGFIYSFPRVRCSCLLSAGILHALLCLKVYSRYICGERCTPSPPTPLPSSFYLQLS